MVYKRVGIFYIYLVLEVTYALYINKVKSIHTRLKNE